MVGKTEFTHGDVLKIFPSIKGISLIKWVERGLINPLYEPHTSGGKRLYSYINLIQIGFIHELTLFGMPTPWIKNEIFPRLTWDSDDEYFTGIFFQYWRIPKTLGKDQLRDDEMKRYAREPLGGVYAGPEKERLFIEGALSYLVVNLDQLQKEINTRLVQEGWK